MGAVSNLVLEIEERLEQGMSFAQIARELDIPVNFVVEASEIMQNESEDCSPFATINS